MTLAGTAGGMKRSMSSVHCLGWGIGSTGFNRDGGGVGLASLSSIACLCASISMSTVGTREDDSWL